MGGNGNGRAAAAALVLTVLIWASYLVVTRAGTQARLGPQDVGLLRYLPAVILFAPIWLRFGLKPARVRWSHAAGVGLLGGFGFVTCLSLGLARAPVADAGVFTPSMLPLFVAILSAIFLRERFTRLRLAGLAMILAGALAIGGWHAVTEGDARAATGHALFLSASFLWACYTLVFRRSGMTATEAGAVMALWSTIGFLIWAALAGTTLPGRDWGFLAFQGVMQGVLSGFLATFTYGVALVRYGPSRTAAFAALVPVLAAAGGAVFLGEAVGPAKAAGIAVVAAGVALASGALRLPARPAPR